MPIEEATPCACLSATADAVRKVRRLLDGVPTACPREGRPNCPTKTGSFAGPRSSPLQRTPQFAVHAVSFPGGEWGPRPGMPQVARPRSHGCLAPSERRDSGRDRRIGVLAPMPVIGANLDEVRVMEDYVSPPQRVLLRYQWWPRRASSTTSTSGSPGSRCHGVSRHSALSRGARNRREPAAGIGRPHRGPRRLPMTLVGMRTFGSAEASRQGGCSLVRWGR